MLVRKTLLGVLLFGSVVIAQNHGTPNQLRVITDANGYLLAAGGTQTAPLTTTVFSNTRLTTDANGNLLVIIGTSTSTVTININGIATTSTDGLVLANNTASTAGVPVQISPRIRLSGSAWDGAASETSDLILENKPTSGATPTGDFRVGFSTNGGALVYPFDIDQAGNFRTLTGGVGTFGGNITINAELLGLSASRVYLGVNGQVLIRNAGATSGAGLDVTTDNLLKVRNRAMNADGNISFAAATASGTITTAANTTTVAPIILTHGTLLSTPTADALESDGVANYSTANTTNGRVFDDGWNYFRLTGSGTGITTIADFFGATGSGIPLVANGVYEIEWHCYFSQATAGTATWTVTTATTALANITGEYIGSNIAGIGAVGAPQTAAINTTTSSATAFPVTGSEASGATHYFTIRVMVTAGNGASNTRLRLTMSAGTATPLINSYFKVRRLPAGNTGAFVS